MSSQQQTDTWYLMGAHWFVCFVRCGFPLLALWRAQVTLSFGFEGIRCFPMPACVCFNWTVCILSCSLRLGLCAGLYWRPSATQQGLLFLHSGHSSRTFSWKRCTELFWHVQGKNFLPKGQYFCRDIYKERKNRLVNDRSHSPIRQWSVVSERCVCISWLLKCYFSFKRSTLPLSFLLSFSACLCSFLPFPSFSTCLSYFLFRNIFPNPTFGSPCCPHCLNPLASSCLSFHGLCGRKSWLSLFPMDLYQSGHLCLGACQSVEWSTIGCLQVSGRSLFIHLCHGERTPASC